MKSPLPNAKAILKKAKPPAVKKTKVTPMKKK